MLTLSVTIQLYLFFVSVYPLPQLDFFCVSPSGGELGWHAAWSSFGTSFVFALPMGGGLQFDGRPRNVEQPPQVLGDIHGVFAQHVVGALLAPVVLVFTLYSLGVPEFFDFEQVVLIKCAKTSG